MSQGYQAPVVEAADLDDGGDVRTVFDVGGYRLERRHVTGESDTLREGGVRYGWVRAGRGRLEYGAGSAGLEPGTFVRIPAGTEYRYVATELDLLSVAVPGASEEAAVPTVVQPDALSPGVESPNLVRETPFPDAPDGVLVLRARAEGGAKAGWHHHGENVYFGYAVDGPSEVEYGDGEGVTRIKVGEYFHVPPGLVHRDTNPTDAAHTAVIWLCGGPPWVVNREP